MNDYYSLRLPILNLPYETISPYLVDFNSRKYLKEAVENIACFFKRELHFDFVPFESSEIPGLQYSMPFEAYLFLEPAYDLMKNDINKFRAIGCSCFRKYCLDNDDWYWCLDWIWFHPYFRNTGRLTKAWPFFLEKYQPYYITPPYSLGMELFLKKVNWKYEIEECIRKSK